MTNFLFTKFISLHFRKQSGLNFPLPKYNIADNCAKQETLQSTGRHFQSILINCHLNIPQMTFTTHIQNAIASSDCVCRNCRFFEFCQFEAHTFLNGLIKLNVVNSRQMFAKT